MQKSTESSPDKKTQVQKMTILHNLSFEGGREGDGEGIIRGQKIDWAGSQAQMGVTYGTNQN